MSNDSQEHWTIVATTSFPHEAHLLKTVLIDHEIEARLQDESMAEAYPGASIALGGVKVLVRSHKAEEAKAILDQATSDDESEAP